MCRHVAHISTGVRCAHARLWHSLTIYAELLIKTHEVTHWASTLTAPHAEQCEAVLPGMSRGGTAHHA